MKTALSSLLVIAALFAIYYAQPAKVSQAAIAGSISASASNVVAQSAATVSSSSQSSMVADVPSPLRADYNEIYFDWFRSRNPDADVVLSNLTPQLSNGPQSKLIAQYIVEGIEPSGSVEEGYFLATLQNRLNQDPYGAALEISAAQRSLSDQPFAEQMLLNLVRDLDVDPAKKAELLGFPLNQAMVFDENGDPDGASMNVTTALIQMAHSGVTIDDARPYIEVGLRANQDDPRALEEFRARVETYYPGALDPADG